jgi:hypothetical protein
LSKNQGKLELNDLMTLSDHAARALANHQYDLSIDRVDELSEEAASALEMKKGKIGWYDASEWVDRMRRKGRFRN